MEGSNNLTMIKGVLQGVALCMSTPTSAEHDLPDCS